MKKSKQALIIQDLSAIGRVSLMTALPILSSAGIHTSCLPTALLSTHSGEFQGFSFHDLTKDMEEIIQHWQSFGLKFDAIQTGYLGSHEQMDAVKKAFDLLGEKGQIIVDPVMGDNGKLYSKISEEMIGAMKSLCQRAKVILPNVTEASFLLGKDYPQEISIAYGEQMAYQLHQSLGVEQIILTGISDHHNNLGALAYDRGNSQYFGNKKFGDHFYGTGDLFTSLFTASLLNDKNLMESAQIATELTYASIVRAKEQQLERRFGVAFEGQIPELIRRLGL